jgi:hypothetical protein
MTPRQRLERMRNSFEKNKSLLAGDYKYFTSPEMPPMPRVSIPRNKAAHRSGERSAPKSPKQS